MTESLFLDISYLYGPRDHLARGFFAQFSGNAKQGFVRDFELDNFLSQLDNFFLELVKLFGKNGLIFNQFWVKNLS